MRRFDKVEGCAPPGRAVHHPRETKSSGGPSVLRRPANRTSCSEHAMRGVALNAKRFCICPNGLQAVRPSAASEPEVVGEPASNQRRRPGLKLLPGRPLVAHTAVMRATSSVALLVPLEPARKAIGAHNSQASNPSIERTAHSQLRWLRSAAHVER